MNRSFRAPLAFSVALVVLLPVVLVGASEWVARNRVFVVAMVALLVWRWLRALAFEEVPAADFEALAKYLAPRHEWQFAQLSVVGRQGCTRAEVPSLRRELSELRAELSARGVVRTRTGWEGLADELSMGTVRAESPADACRLAVLGQHGRAEERITALAAERVGTSTGVLLDWLRSGRTDEAGLERVRAALEAERLPVLAESPDAWVLCSTPSDEARRFLELLRQHQRELERTARDGDGDGDFAELVHREGSALALLSAVEASWASGSTAALPAAFRAYAEATVDFYAVEPLVASAWLETRVLGATTDAALGRLRALVPSPGAPPDAAALAEAPLRALDAVLAKLLLGLGLMVRTTNESVVVAAWPHGVERDFI